MRLELAAALQQNVEITLFNTSPNQIHLYKNHKSKNNAFTFFYYKDLVTILTSFKFKFKM